METTSWRLWQRCCLFCGTWSAWSRLTTECLTLGRTTSSKPSKACQRSRTWVSFFLRRGVPIVSIDQKGRSIKTVQYLIATEFMSRLVNTIIPSKLATESQSSVDLDFSSPDNTLSVSCPDLSENEVGVLAAHELREYMKNRRCHLRSIAIRKADIDDDECRRETFHLVSVNNGCLLSPFFSASSEFGRKGALSHLSDSFVIFRPPTLRQRIHGRTGEQRFLAGS